MKDKIRREFRRNQTWSARLVKQHLVRAYNVPPIFKITLIQSHSRIEKAIQGDQKALNSLMQSFGTPKPSKSVPLPKPVLPPPPPPVDPPLPNVYKPPTIRYGQFTLPVMIYPILKPSPSTTIRFLTKIQLLRHYIDQTSFLIQMLYHAKLEERFLSRLSAETRQNWGYGVEAGVRELSGMIKFLEKLKWEIELRENVIVENKIKEWVLKHPNVKFREYGMRMKRSRRKELKAWNTKVKELERNHEQTATINSFMEKWESSWGKNNNVTLYRHPNGRKAKRAAKKLRKLKLGR